MAAGSSEPRLPRQRQTRRRVLLILLGTALLSASVWQGPAIWRLATTKVLYELGTDSVVYEWRVHRWREDELGIERVLTVRAWQKTGELSVSSDMEAGRHTYWNSDGSIMAQTYLEAGRLIDIVEPPWRWGVSEDHDLSAPWDWAGLTLEEWWEALPASSRIGS